MPQREELNENIQLVFSASRLICMHHKCLIRIFLTCLSWLFVWLAFPGGPLPQMVWICLVPLILALEGTRARAGFLYGLAFGSLSWLGSVWGFGRGITSLYDCSIGAAWFWTSVFCVFHALPYGIFGWLYGRFQWMEKPFGALRCSACLCLLLMWFPVIVPGNHAHALSAFPYFIQILDLGGVPLLLFFVNLVNFLVVDFVLALKKGKRVTWILAALIIVLGMTAAYGRYRLTVLEGDMQKAGPNAWIRISAVQPNIPLQGRTGEVPVEDRGNDLDTAMSLTRKVALEYPYTDLIVWPELPLLMFCQDDSTEKIISLVKEIRKPLLFSCSRRAEKDKPERAYNAAILVRESGEMGPEYHKRILFPFGEYLPFEKALSCLGMERPRFLKTIKGHAPTVFDLNGNRHVVPAICYESLFSGFIRDFVPAGGNVIVNMADDIWFGRSRVADIHSSLALFRTVEFRMPMAIVTNSGVGFFVEPTGRIVKGSRTPHLRKAATSFPLFIPEVRSPYYYLGDAFLWVLTLFWMIHWVCSAVCYRARGKKDICCALQE
jgi:apolipoprotein N-acyltransferase